MTRDDSCVGLIGTYFGTAAGTTGVNQVGETAFKRQLYQSMIAQLIFLKVQIESWRSSNAWGTTFWMFNEIWPVEIPPLATENLLENTEGAPHHCSLGTAACYLLFTC